MLFEDDIFKMEIPLEEISGLESADKPAEITNQPAINRLKPATNQKQVCKHNE